MQQTDTSKTPGQMTQEEFEIFRFKRPLKHFTMDEMKPMSKDSGLTFKEWYWMANRFVERKVGMPLVCMPDIRSRDAYEDDATILSFFENDVIEMLEEEGYPDIDSLLDDE